jgi:hypothetical protein
MTMRTTASRCDQIIALIDACLAEFESSSSASASRQSPRLGGVTVGPWSPTYAQPSR